MMRREDEHSPLTLPRATNYAASSRIPRDNAPSEGTSEQHVAATLGPTQCSPASRQRDNHGSVKGELSARLGYVPLEEQVSV